MRHLATPLMTANVRTFPLAGTCAILPSFIAYDVKVRCVTSVFTVSPLAANVACIFQIVQRPLHCARREVQVAGYGFHARPAASTACTVTEVHIDCPSSVRQIRISIDGAEEAHLSP